MSLLAPALLAGLALLAVPVLVHLTRRHRGQVVEFPSLMFLRKTPFPATQRRRIRHPLLFALRCLAVVLVALAFARPFVGGADAADGERALDLVILLDLSGSVAADGREDAARRAARTAIDGLGEEDRAALVTFDDRAVERAALTGDRVALTAALETARRTDRPTRIESGLQLAGRILGESDRALRDVLLVSDFQRSGWADGGRTRLPDGVSLRSVDVGAAGGGTGNAAVADLRVTDEGDGRHRFLARVISLSDEAIAGLPVSLELGGRTVATTTVDLEPRGAATVGFDDVPIPAGAPRGAVRLGRGDDAAADVDGGAIDALATDDALRFLAAPEPALEAVLVEAPRGRADRSLFLSRALELAETPRVGLVRRPAGQLDEATLARASAVVLNDAPVDGATATRLEAWVAGGGALFVVLGPESSVARWAEADDGLLGAAVGEIVDRAARGGARLAWIDYDHPVFAPFAVPGSGDFASSRFWRYRGIEPASDARALARFDDGGIALLEWRLGEGRVLTWASTLDRFWNDLALQPVFPPFVHRAVRHAAAYEAPERWVEAGTSRPLARILGPEADPEAGTWVLVTPAGERRPVTASDPADGEADGREAWIEFDEAGFYRLEARDDAARATEVAVNLPLAESDLASVSPEQVASAAVGGSAGAGDGLAASGSRDVEAEDPAEAGVPARRELWWPLLLLAGCVLVAESWLANRWSPPATRDRRSA